MADTAEPMDVDDTQAVVKKTKVPVDATPAGKKRFEVKKVDFAHGSSGLTA
jgi:hypothetical protein